jgi:ribonuclease E
VKHALAQIAASTIVHAEQKPETAASNAVSTTRSADETDGAPAASTGRTAGGRRSRHRRVTQEQGAAESAPAAEPTGSTATVPVDDTARDSVQLLDLPVPPVERKRPARAPEAEVLLDSVLDALPAPKKAGEGRARSRRVSTAALSGAGGAPVITRADGSDASESSVDD